jgi:hypothetical protein
MKVLKKMNHEKKFAKVVFTCPATDKYLFTLARNRGGGKNLCHMDAFFLFSMLK